MLRLVLLIVSACCMAGGFYLVWLDWAYSFLYGFGCWMTGLWLMLVRGEDI
jgi:hypothetical protein